MKKPVVFLVAPALLISVLLVSGCGIFRSHKDWQAAQQQSPLEIPPGLDTPATNDALVVPPPGANQPNANGDTAEVDGVPGQLTDGFIVPSEAGTVYAKLGTSLAEGKLGKVLGTDANARTYTVSVVSAAGTALTAKKHGFVGRMFHHDKDSSSTDQGAQSAHDVTITVVASGADASVVQVHGIAGAVVKSVNELHDELGVKN